MRRASMLLPILLTMHTAEGDSGLLAGLQRREPRALAELYDRYGRVAYSSILRAVRDPVIAEGLLQETFLRAWNRAPDFDAAPGAIGPWLLAVARNRAMNYLRSDGGRERTTEFDECDHPALFAGMEPGSLASDKLRRVKAALDKLAAHQRQAIELAYFEGLSQTEMARRMGQPLETVRNWARAAWKSLREATGEAAAPAYCAGLQDDYSLYLLGLADERERGEIRRHLDRGCETCGLAMKQACELAALVGATAAAAPPSPRLRRRILASAGFEERRFGWAPFLAGVAALALCAAVYFAGREREFSEEALRLREGTRDQTIELSRLREALAIVQGPDTIATAFGDSQAKPKGRIFVNSSGVLLIASNLPPAPAGKAYEMWVIPKGAKPVPAGLFQAASDGTAIHVERRAVDRAGVDVVTVTVEDAAGAEAPAGTPLITARMRAVQ